MNKEEKEVIEKNEEEEYGGKFCDRQTHSYSTKGKQRTPPARALHLLCPWHGEGLGSIKHSIVLVDSLKYSTIRWYPLLYE